MTTRDWLQLVGYVMTLAGVWVAARRSGISSDRAQLVARESAQAQSDAAESSAENSAYTRAQKMIKEAAAAQQAAFEAAEARMRAEINELRERVTGQDQKIAAQHREIVELQRGRENDRTIYTRYIQKLLDLLEKHEIVYPQPPPFFD